jgi:hypothetical protein
VTARWYCVRVTGRLSERLADAFDGFILEQEPGGTVLSGQCRDSTALYGLLLRISDLGLELLEVQSREVDDPGVPEASH